jgi:diguanylate cyclase (GGDEF)-like protein
VPAAPAAGRGSILNKSVDIRSLAPGPSPPGSHWLHLGRLAEDDFRAYYVQASYAKTRPVLVLTTAFVIACMIGAAWMGTLSLPMALFVGLVILPTLGGTLAASYLSQRHELYQVLLALGALWIGLICTSIATRASLGGMSYYLALQVAWIFLVWQVLGLRFCYAAAAAITLSLVYVGGMVWWNFPLQEALFAGALLLAVNLIGGYSCYQLESALRLAFRESRLLSELAERDGLTGLFNRRSFDHYLSRLWRQSQREQAQLAVLLIDIDYFKAFNDHKGHQAGDDAMKRVAGAIALCAQRPLDFAARYGGEEFALVLYGPPGGSARELPEQLRSSIERLGIPHGPSQASDYLTVSIGVAVLMPGSERSLAGAIQLADEALYQAKEEGRNRVVIKESRLNHIETGRFRARRQRQRAS